MNFDEVGSVCVSQLSLVNQSLLFYVFGGRMVTTLHILKATGMWLFGSFCYLHVKSSNPLLSRI